MDYLFLHMFVDEPRVSDAQGCGTILAGVGPAAIELGLVPARDATTSVGIHIRITGEVALASICNTRRRLPYAGIALIEYPGGAMDVLPEQDVVARFVRSENRRTTRKLMSGRVFPGRRWPVPPYRMPSVPAPAPVAICNLAQASATSRCAAATDNSAVVTDLSLSSRSSAVSAPTL